MCHSEINAADEAEKYFQPYRWVFLKGKKICG